MVIEAMSSLPDDDDSGDPGADAVNQISLDDFLKPADWPEDKNWELGHTHHRCLLHASRHHLGLPEKARARFANAESGHQATCLVALTLQLDACFQANCDPSEPYSGSP
jgi:hypothetical protein